MDQDQQANRIIEFIKGGEKPKRDFKIGVELEHIVVRKEDFQSITYYEEKGIESILKNLIPQGYKPNYEGDYVIGLEGKDEVITLEPGGQLEISIRPCSTIKEVEDIYLAFLKKIIPILEKENQLLMAIGYHPKTSIKDIPFNPKGRYKHMADYLITKGKYAHNMMKGTASLQVVIDYENQEDFMKKFRVANFLSPLFHLITDNAPIFEGKVYQDNSVRSTIWENMDKDRSGIVPGALQEDFGYKAYAQYILNTPPIFIIKNGEVITTHNKKTKELIDFYRATDEEIDHILSMVFPDVRARQYIEIRMGDTLPYPLSMAYVALIKGIFYNDVALAYLYEMAKGTEEEKVYRAKENIGKKGFEGSFKCKTAGDFIPILFDLARKGLDQEERKYLEGLEALALKHANPAQVLKARIASVGDEALGWCSLNKYGRGIDSDSKK
ncbi:glutamate--cysteine ligase [Natronincola ferrireducens]|uniref:Glutamate--cysteine ligase n=1 Tax=Natronincola ferrireducens TaxID=393762 RepID=A0A1G9F8R8_9FIRM|nr:glutamate-cysteine ligase family protein [Natronincola ferrireducens]SDK84738.1 glutamate--cysteine ligase [Natronincola ferrireducens]